MSAPMAESVHSTAWYTWSKGEQKKWLDVAELNCNSGVVNQRNYQNEGRNDLIREKSEIYDKQTENYLIGLRAYTYRHSKAQEVRLYR